MKNYTQKDYYKILGLNYEAKPEDIKRAFRRATVKYHPDVNKSGEKIFMEIKEAYEILIDENERKNYDFVKGYDILRKQKEFERRNNYASFEGSENIRKENFNKYYENEFKRNQTNTKNQNDTKKKEYSKKENNNREKFNNNFLETVKKIFTTLLREQNNKKETREEEKPIDGEDIIMPIEISLKEAINGTNRKINVLHTEVCPICGGKQFVNNSDCKYCKGTGEISHHKKLNVKIPPHSENNKKIRLKNEGTKGLKGGKNGHLYLIVKITDDSYFKFEGNNVLCEAEIMPFEAALGCNKEIKTLSGMVNLKIPSGTSSGQKFRLTGEGLFDEKTKTKGHQIVTVKIKMKECLSEHEKKLYEELRRLSEEK